MNKKALLLVIASMYSMSVRSEELNNEEVVEQAQVELLEENAEAVTKSFSAAIAQGAHTLYQYIQHLFHSAEQHAAQQGNTIDPTADAMGDAAGSVVSNFLQPVIGQVMAEAAGSLVNHTIDNVGDLVADQFGSGNALVIAQNVAEQIEEAITQPHAAAEEAVAEAPVAEHVATDISHEVVQQVEAYVTSPENRLNYQQLYNIAQSENQYVLTMPSAFNNSDPVSVSLVDAGNGMMEIRQQLAINPELTLQVTYQVRKPRGFDIDCASAQVSITQESLIRIVFNIVATGEVRSALAEDNNVEGSYIVEVLKAHA